MGIKYKKEDLEKYKEELSLVASLSNLFSDSDTPLIYYRATENMYCDSFNAINVSRTDCTADAVLQKTGVGIKTFLADTKNQKIAEFNRQRPLYAGLNGVDLALAISSLRNERIDTTMRLYGLNEMIYHCVVRDIGKIEIYEEPMHRIDISNITLLVSDDKKITFTDGLETYEFLFSKSTLYKIFNLNKLIMSFNVKILENPIEQLRAFAEQFRYSTQSSTTHYSRLLNCEKLRIPLYSTNKNGNFVGEKSGLNQWNAAGRKRDPNEIYIPYPAKIRKESINFFPDRNTKWKLKLPNGSELTMKVCQQGDKALMSDPNKDLGKWILRDVLQLHEGTLLTYDDLLKKGIDTVEFTKKRNKYFIDFIVFDE